MKDDHRYYEIDFLRGAACIAVIAYHYLSIGPAAGWIIYEPSSVATAFSRYGYMGVHLFFMISGFVILLSANGATPRMFVASRVARLYPAFWVSASLTALVVWLAGDSRFAVSPSDYLVNMTMFPHWFAVPYLDGAYWSLAVELHFYIYVVIILRLGWFRRLDWLLAGWLLVSLINAVRPIWPVEFWLNARWAPFFVAGGLFFLIRTRGVTVPRLGLLVGAYGLAVFYAVTEAEKLSARYANLLTVQAAKDGTFEYLSPEIVIAVITAFFALFALIAFRRWSLANSPAVAWSGALTYPVYLLHQNIGYVLHPYLINFLDSAIFGLLMTLATVIGFAWAVHHWAERNLGPKIKSILSSNSPANGLS